MLFNFFYFCVELKTISLKYHQTYYLLLLFFLLLTSTVVIPQRISKTDSLEYALILVMDEKKKVDIFIQLSNELLTSNPDKAKTYAEDALYLSEVNDYEEGQLLSLINLAEIYQIKTDLKNSIEHALLAKEIANRMNLKEEYARSILIIANCLRQLEEYNKSSDFCFEALDIYESVDNQLGVCDAQNAIGCVYAEQKEYDKALKYFSVALTLARKLEDQRGIGRGLNNIAFLFGEKNETEKSIKYTNQAIEINEKSGRKQWQGNSYNNIAQYYLDIDQYDSAFKYINRAIEINKELNNRYNLSESYIIQAKCYKEIGNEKKFLNYANMALMIGQENNLKNVNFQVAFILQSYYQSIGQWDSAYKFKSFQYDMKDSLDTKSSLTRLSQLELIYDIEKKEQVRKLKTQRKDFIIRLIFISLLAGLVIILLLLFRYRIKVRYSKLKQLKLEDELEFKNKELTSNVMSLMKKNEMLSDITGKLIEIEINASKDETKAAIRKIALEIENSAQEKIWKEFEMRFRQVHSAFYDKLIQRYPDITPNEQRLCAFLKLNLSTKEISSISGQSSRAIEMARFRLRKKLHISSHDVSLVTFISKI